MVHLPLAPTILPSTRWYVTIVPSARTSRVGAGPLPASLLDRGQPPSRETHDPHYGGGTSMEPLLLVGHNTLFGDGLALLFEWRTGLSSVRAGSLAEARAILEEAERK